MVGHERDLSMVVGALERLGVEVRWERCEGDGGLVRLKDRDVVFVNTQALPFRQLAVCLDALAMLFTAMGFFIPAALGVQDGGNVLLALGFHLGATLGAAFSILRRLREAFWMGLGLLLAVQER